MIGDPPAMAARELAVPLDLSPYRSEVLGHAPPGLPLAADAPAPPQPPPVQAPPTPPLRLVLLGVIEYAGGSVPRFRAAVYDPTDASVRELGAEDTVHGRRVLTVDRDGLTVARGDGSQRLSLQGDGEASGRSIEREGLGSGSGTPRSPAGGQR